MLQHKRDAVGHGRRAEVCACPPLSALLHHLGCRLTPHALTLRPPRPAQRLDLKLDVGESGLDYAEVAKKEHLSELELEIRKLKCIPHPMFKREACGADVYATLDREQFGMDAGKAYGFSMAVDLRIQVEALATK